MEGSGRLGFRQVAQEGVCERSNLPVAVGGGGARPPMGSQLGQAMRSDRLACCADLAWALGYRRTTWEERRNPELLDANGAAWELEGAAQPWRWQGPAGLATADFRTLG